MEITWGLSLGYYQEKLLPAPVGWAFETYRNGNNLGTVPKLLTLKYEGTGIEVRLERQGETTFIFGLMAN